MSILTVGQNCFLKVKSFFEGAMKTSFVSLPEKYFATGKRMVA